MTDAEAAKKAIADLNGSVVAGRSIVVNEAEERKPRENRSSGGYGGASRGGYSRDNNRRPR